MEKIATITSKIIPLPRNSIDTDQIIPARYLKAVDKKGMANGLFADWRYNPDGTPKADFVLNQPRYQGAKILLAGDNFGCGSSREHAPWALIGWGIRAVISTSFADIFKNNALKNGLLPIAVDQSTFQSLLDLTQELPDAEITIDLEKQWIALPDTKTIAFEIEPFARRCLLMGVDQLGYILSFEKQIFAYEEKMAQL